MNVEFAFVKNKTEAQTRENDKAKVKGVTMTSRRDFSNLPKYSGKHDEFDEWKFKMVTFLSEENDFKELILQLDKLKELPDNEKAKSILSDVWFKCGQDKDQG